MPALADAIPLEDYGQCRDCIFRFYEHCTNQEAISEYGFMEPQISLQGVYRGKISEIINRTIECAYRNVKS